MGRIANGIRCKATHSMTLLFPCRLFCFCFFCDSFWCSLWSKTNWNVAGKFCSTVTMWHHTMLWSVCVCVRLLGCAHAVSETTNIAFSPCSDRIFFGLHFSVRKIADKYQSRQEDGNRSICSNFIWRMTERSLWHRLLTIISSRKIARKWRNTININYHMCWLTLFVCKLARSQTHRFTEKTHWIEGAI